MTSQERVANMALGGAELKKIILADVNTLLDNEGMLSHYMGYGRVGYRVRLELYIDNPHTPRSSSHIISKPHATAAIAADPSLGAVETPPLRDPSPEATIGATEISRNISSPNAERLRAGMPIPVEVRQQDGTTTLEKIKYPASEADPGDVVIEDVSLAAQAEWGPKT